MWPWEKRFYLNWSGEILSPESHIPVIHFEMILNVGIGEKKKGKNILI